MNEQQQKQAYLALMNIPGMYGPGPSNGINPVAMSRTPEGLIEALKLIASEMVRLHDKIDKLQIEAHQTNRDIEGLRRVFGLT